LKLLGEVLQTLEISSSGRIASVYVAQEMMQRLGATKDFIDGYVNYPRSIAGVDVAFLLSEVSSLKGTSKYKVSFRSKGLVNVAEIAAELGGGGHPNASGCAVEGTLDEAKNIIKNLVEEKMKEQNL
jgi:phosphoesterase RecJ-like protein